ncbi:MAG: hypothetical protein F9K23_15345 [Bacteroidetes bacterium]|nr:MAG: hypothetical protein F9K23_15345 [Bacteroidota bacterium]
MQLKKTRIKLKSFLSIVNTAAILFVLSSSCNKEEKNCGCTDVEAYNYNSKANCDDSSCTYKGKATFWIYDQTWGMTSRVVVKLEGVSESQMITMSYIPITAPYYCNANGCANFTLPVGKYKYEAKLLTGSIRPDTTFNGTINVEKNSCTLVKFER